MECAMQQQNLSPPPRPPKRYWDDGEWAIQNITMLTEKYPDEWVVIFGKRVVAHGEDLDQVLFTTQSQGLQSPLIKFIERGIRVYKYFARVSTEPYEAIVDTGNPITVIPLRIHQQIFSQLLYPGKINLSGIGQGIVQGQLASIIMSFHDQQTTSLPLQAKAYLLDDNSTPLIVGYEDALTELRLISDYPQQMGHFEIP
jgi:hypothetical protein